MSHLDTVSFHSELRRARELAREIGAAEADMAAQWQPLATAPTDGTDVLVWVRWKNAPPSATRVYFDRREWRRVATGRPIAREAIVGWEASGAAAS